ncbi:tyrosine-type recombinase/integrase [Fusobacteria bacterium ZRK30]|nr:tyrosine-type recombinase/integrase [Fusobacteria bacterium ZRK30]
MLSKIPGFKEFEKHMKDSSFSYNSCEAYKKDIDDFFIFIRYKPLNEIVEEDILNFIKDLKKVYSNNSINRKIISIRGYLKYFYKNGIIDSLPMEKIKNLPPEKRTLEILSLEEIEKLREIMDDSPKEYRDRTILDILYETGILISEVLDLRCEDIISEDYKVITQIKGVKINKIPLDNSLSERLQIFIEEKRDQLRNKNTKIFSSISRQNYRARLIKYGKRASLDREIYTHMIRNSVLKNILDTEGAHVVKDRMGYSTIQNTSLYSSRNTQQIKKIYMEIGIGDE